MCDIRCGTCGWFQWFREHFDYVEDTAVERVTDAAFADLERRGIGICTADDPMPTSADSTISSSERWDCWVQAPRRWKEEGC